MTPILWITVSFSAGLMLFLIAVFFLRENATATQYNILKFLTSICAGIAGYFIGGTALFNLTSNFGQKGTITVSGTAGAAFFFTVWFLYPKRVPPPPPDAFNYSVPPNMTFSGMVNIIVENANKFVEFKNFTETQLKTPLATREIHTKSIKEALESSRYLNSALPKYSVTENLNVFTLETHS
jgi:hypothetical protein